MSRLITTHKVAGLNDEIDIVVNDDPGAGGACHDYTIGQGFHGPVNAMHILADIRFQNGPIKETRVNGISNEALLAIVQDRLEGFQSGDFACDANAHALFHVKAAIEALHARTRERLARNVEGTNTK